MLKSNSKMLAFQIQDDKKQILEKYLKRNSKMLILGMDDQGHNQRNPCISIKNFKKISI